MDTFNNTQVTFNNSTFDSAVEAQWALYFDKFGIDYQYLNEVSFPLEKEVAKKHSIAFYLPNHGYFLQLEGFRFDNDLPNIQETFPAVGNKPVIHTKSQQVNSDMILLEPSDGEGYSDLEIEICPVGSEHKILPGTIKASALSQDIEWAIYLELVGLEYTINGDHLFLPEHNTYLVTSRDSIYGEDFYNSAESYLENGYSVILLQEEYEPELKFYTLLKPTQDGVERNGVRLLPGLSPDLGNNVLVLSNLLKKKAV